MIIDPLRYFLEQTVPSFDSIPDLSHMNVDMREVVASLKADVVFGFYSDGRRTIIHGEDFLKKIAESTKCKVASVSAIRLANIQQAECLAAAVEVLRAGQSVPLRWFRSRLRSLAKEPDRHLN
jgi:hypothetical protein